MFDLNDPSTGQVSKTRRRDVGDLDTYDLPAEPDGEGTGRRTHPLDTSRSQALHRRLLGHYLRELDRQSLNRIEMQIDADFYDSIQWREEDAAELIARGQHPLVYNVIGTTVDWILGTEKRARTDFKALPRRKADSKPAERKTQLLKYLADVNKSPFSVSRSFADSTKVGVGWIEDAVQDDSEEEPIYSRYESWRSMLWDSVATELDLSDARYVIRSKWMDIDVASAAFPERSSVIRAAADRADEYRGLSAYADEAMDQPEIEPEMTGRYGPEDAEASWRGRVRMIECWYRAPTMTDKIRGGAFHGEIHDPHSPGHAEALASGEARLHRQMVMRMHVAVMTTAGLLFNGVSPYRHNRFPFTPVWGFRRDRDNMPYGIIRRLRGMQEDINKRASKALYILSTNKVIVEEGASDDMDALIEEAQRPDGVMVVNAGKISAIKLDVERELSQGHLELMSRSIAMVQQSGGVTDENLGRRTNATSGIAIGRRQDQGAVATAGLFDNLRYAQLTRGEKLLSLCEQFVSEPKAIRITNMRGTPEYVDINDGLPENDIGRSKADFVISESDWRASVRQAAVEELLEIVAKLAPAAPQLVMVMLDLIVESMDVPGRDELVRRIRAITGQPDPDADEETPEQIERQQQEQAQKAMEMRALQAQLAKAEAEAARAAAQAEKLRADIAAVGVTTQRSALDAATTLLAAPAAAAPADFILKEAGFIADSERQAAMEIAAEAAARAAPAQPAPTPTPGGQS